MALRDVPPSLRRPFTPSVVYEARKRYFPMSHPLCFVFLLLRTPITANRYGNPVLQQKDRFAGKFFARPGERAPDRPGNRQNARLIRTRFLRSGRLKFYNCVSNHSSISGDSLGLPQNNSCKTSPSHTCIDWVRSVSCSSPNFHPLNLEGIHRTSCQTRTSCWIPYCQKFEPPSLVLHHLGVVFESSPSLLYPHQSSHYQSSRSELG